MTRVVASEEGDWFLARIEGPRSVRAALRQSIPPAQLEHEPDGQLWRIRRSAWPTACTVFSRFEIPISWTSNESLGVAYGPAVPPVEVPPAWEAVSRSSDLDPVESAPVQRAVDSLDPAANAGVVHIEDIPQAEAGLADLPHVKDVAEVEAAPGMPIYDVAHGTGVPAIEVPPAAFRSNDLDPVESASVEGAIADLEPSADADAARIEDRRQIGVVLELADVPPATDVREVEAASEVEIHDKEYEMQQAEYGEFTVTISGNGLSVERTVDSQTAWSILAKLFGREATSREEALTANGRLAGS